MSKYKKTWLPIAIILVLAALILLLAMIGSKFSDDSEELNESPEPSAEVTPTPPPTPTPTPEPTPAPTPVPKKVNNTVKENTRTEEKEADKSDWEKFGEQVGKGMKDARENFENGMKEIGDRISENITTPQEIADNVSDFFSGLASASSRDTKR